MMKKFLISKHLIGVILLSLLTSFCSRESGDVEKLPEASTEEHPPQLRTVEIKDISTNGALAIGKIVDRGSTSIIERGTSFRPSGSPAGEDNTVKAQKVTGGGEFEVEVSGLESNTDYKLRTYAVNQQGIAYSDQTTFKTRAARIPSLNTSAITVSGANVAFIDSELVDEGGANVTEKGIAWSQNESPTREDSKLISSEQEFQFKSRLEGLEPNSRYYVRSYAINSEGVAYGDQVEINTIAKGNITYTLHKDPNPGEELREIFDRIDRAFQNAVEFYNNFTSIHKHLNVHYNPGVPTADGHINGTIRVGSNPSYQRTGTAMHEIMHTVGVGQHWRWNELISGGTYKGSRANDILRMMTNNPEAVIKGDSHHFWPYGINGAHEDNEEEMLYIIHALILQGMKADGLPSE